MRRLILPLSLLLLGMLLRSDNSDIHNKPILILEGEDTIALGGRLKNFDKKELLLIPGVGDTLANEIIRSKTLLEAKGVGEKTEKKLKKFLDRK